MKRYTTRIEPPRADWPFEAPQNLPLPTVYPTEPIDTGIVDAKGRRILRLPGPLGFLVPRGDEK